MRMCQTYDWNGWLSAAWTFACLVVLLCCAPRLAWADECGDIPEGILTLCDNPFAVDCGHDHSSAASASQVEATSDINPVNNGLSAKDDAASVGSNGSSYCASELPCQSDLGEELADSQSGAVRFDEASLIQSAQISSSSIASKNASNASETADLRSTPFEGARLIVEDEGIFRHEYATILAGVRAGISRSEFDGLVNSAGGLCADSVTDEDLEYGLVKLGIVDNSSVLQTVYRVRQIAGFIGVQPNYVYSAEAIDAHTIVNDRYSSRLWGLESVSAYAAWDIVKANNSVAVAVIDTGADLDHPDLAPNIIATHNSLSAVNTVEDALGHGSHVAGIIAGVANNSLGIAGVSYNANLVIIKASPYRTSDFDTASIVRAYAWLESIDSTGDTVAKHYNVRVVNLSVGGLDATRSSNLRDDALINAIIKARDEYGILTVASAGNGASPNLPFPAYPGDSDACLSVMNLDRVADAETGASTLGLHETSNYNVAGTSYKDLCAPGSTITSAWIDGGYAVSSGTSMAAPMVSGIAAMLFAVNPNLTPQMVMSILEFTATDLGDEGWDEKYGYGEVNAAAAVRLASAAGIDGCRVVGVGGSAAFTASLGPGMEEDGSVGRTWKVWNGMGSATVSSDGVLTGVIQGEVTLVSTCKATTGAEVTATKTVYVLGSSIVGGTMLTVGSASEVYTTTAPEWTWVWRVENDTGAAHIDQDAILIADEPGVIYVTATCASNTDIVLRKRVTIVA